MSLSEEILRESRQKRESLGWLERVPKEHHAALQEVRDSWLRDGGSAGGVSATRLATIITAKLSERGIVVPKVRQVQRWLTAKT